ncbi:hypothetical protein DRH27_05045 [Candidatus Falkowbacteria bacterium]|nr:MAG: hypothetical protein DRH27_05045 [Candidatus Falkowbacteria bacterium]
MVNLFKTIHKKINGVIWSLLSTGIILLMLSVLIVWTDFMLRLIIGLFILIIAYIFLYGGYKLWALRKDIEDHFKF